jgi:uncharacterized delta-60 repeat protein
VQADGKIVVAGYSYTNSSSTFALARYNSDGSLDNTFTSDGKVTTAIGSASGAKSVALQPDGKIVAAGFSASGSNNMFAVARYISASNIVVIDFSDSKDLVLLYPNPVKQNATFEFSLDRKKTVSIRLFDMQGKIIKTFLDNQLLDEGNHQLAIEMPEWLASGMYSLVLTTDGKQESIKIVR